MRLPSLKRFVMDYLLCAFEAALMMFAWGDVRSFFAHGARAGTVVVLLLVPFITIWGKSERINRGLRSVPGQWQTLAVLELAFFVCYLIVPYLDRRGLLVLPEADALRYAGLLLFIAGIALRTWAFVYLGRFFSIFLTIQEGHRLVTDNIYKYVRHPSYTGLLVRSLGWVLVFRSLFGLGAWLLLVVFLIRRIRHEESVLASEFTSEWDGYRRRTPWRLMPGVY
jgi:protein-S-isoprenylcysteine O-methyltransferase Ste14